MPKENIERAIKKGTGELRGRRLPGSDLRGLRPGRRRAHDRRGHRQPDAHRGRGSRQDCRASAATSARRTRSRGCSRGRARSTSTRRDRRGCAHGARPRRRRRRRAARRRRSSSSSTGRTDFHAVQAALKSRRRRRSSRPSWRWCRRTPCRSRGKDAESLLKLLETIEELDDVQKVWANFDIDVAEMAKVEG